MITGTSFATQPAQLSPPNSVTRDSTYLTLAPGGCSVLCPISTISTSQVGFHLITDEQQDLCPGIEVSLDLTLDTWSRGSGFSDYEHVLLSGSEEECGIKGSEEGVPGQENWFLIIHALSWMLLLCPAD